VAAGAATAALVASLVAAVGPARGEHAEFEWPPPTLPSSAPARGWYAPLPLLNRVPSSIVVWLPCALAPPLRDDAPVTIIATARHPERTDALWIALRGKSLNVGVGESEIARLPWPTACPLRMEMRDGELRLPGRTLELRTGTLADMPIVTGLFSNLDLQAGERPHVVVRTRDYATSPTARQVVAAAAAVGLVCLALFLLVGRTRPRRPPRLRRQLASAWRARDGTDAVVVAALLVWWIVAPAYVDDGWFWTEQHAFADLGAVSFYYDFWAVISPLGHWPVWLGHWAIGSTNDLVLMRLPVLAVLLASWLLCRVCLRTVLREQASRGARWILAGAFLVGATAWSMTLRPEPLVAMLTLACLMSMVSFRLEPRMSRLASAVIATVLALTAHPTGIVAMAPLIAGAPDAVRALRKGRDRLFGGVAVLLLAGLALGLVLFTFDADLAHRLGDARVVTDGEVQGQSFWHEYLRYTKFEDWGGGTPLRRLSLMLMILSLAAALTRRRTGRTDVLLLPAWSVGIGLALLAFVPTKWPWHFGSLAAIAAVSTAAEAERLARERASAPRTFRPIVALAVISGVALAAWSDPGRSGSPFDLQRLSWRDGFNVYTWLIGALLIAAVAVAAGRVTSRRQRRPTPDLLSSLIAWALAGVSFAAVGVTIAVLAIDAVKVPWSPARQNLETLVGRSSCGLAHQLSSGNALADRIAEPSKPTLVHPSVGLYFPCATIPRIAGGLAEIPAVVVFQSNWPLFRKDSPFSGASDLYEFRLIAHGPHGIEVYSVRDAVPEFVRADAIAEIGHSD